MYKNLIQVAHRLIEKFGTKIVYRQITEEIDNERPWNASVQNVSEHEIYMAFLPVDRESFKTLQITHEVIPDGFVMAYASIQNFRPSLKDVVVRNDEILKVFSIEEMKPADDSVYYKFILRI